MNLKLLLFIYWIIPTCLIAQTHIQGHVKDKEGHAVGAAIITAHMPNDSCIIAYDMTDDTGAYLLKFNTQAQTIILRLSAFNIKKEWKTINNISQSINWEAIEENLLLKEVQIKARKLWGKDTLNYLVAAYIKSHDSAIGDVIKRLPGIEITPDGTIKYQGVPINKFYIEGMDVLQGRYNLATSHIKASDVATVQIMENHQHIKALQDQIPPESAAVNLKLKKEAKGIWNKSFHIGVGYDENMLWDNNANLMFFGKQQQHILFYGNSNTGKGEHLFSSHYDGGSISPDKITGLVLPGTAPVGNSRFDNAHRITSNNLHKINDEAEIRYALAYNHDILRGNSLARTTYYMPDNGIQILQENIYARHTTNDLDFNFDYEKNANQAFVKNTIRFTGIWEEGHGNVATTNQENIRQRSFNRTLGIQDNLKWIYRTEEGNGYEWNSKNIIQTTPQSLTVRPGVYSEMLHDSKEYALTRQDILVNRITSYNRFSLLNDIRKKRLTFVPTAHVDIEHIGLESTLSTYDELFENKIPGKMNYTLLKTGFGLDVRYVWRKLFFRVSFPLNFTWTNLFNSTFSDTKNNSNSHFQTYFTPSTSLTWRINDSWVLNGEAHYKSNPTSWKQLYSFYILGNYRNLNRYQTKLYDTENIMGRLKANYKNIFNELFAYIETVLTHSKSDILYNTILDENSMSINEPVYAPHHNTSYSATGNIRKDFETKDVSIGVTGQASYNNGQFMRQGEHVRFHSNRYSATCHFSFTPVSIVHFNYNTTYSTNKSETENGRKAETIKNWNNTAEFHITLLKNILFLSVYGNHTYNDGLLKTKNHIFLNADIRFRMNKKIEIKLSTENILNTRRYIVQSSSDMTDFYSEYYLRPRSTMLSIQINL